MPYLKSFREGWNHERFGKFLLGKVSFLSTPDTIGDDTGSDASGFFLERHPTKPTMLIPSLPYAMQIRPQRDKQFVGKHIHELAALGGRTGENYPLSPNKRDRCAPEESDLLRRTNVIRFAGTN